jgi:hypothetical protein
MKRARLTKSRCFHAKCRQLPTAFAYIGIHVGLVSAESPFDFWSVKCKAIAVLPMSGRTGLLRNCNQFRSRMIPWTRS